jgi:5-hydroxyisourate hydrolase
MSAITTHVLDTSLGRPAVGVPVILERSLPGRAPEVLGRGVTDHDGRLRELAPAGPLAPGTYRLRFDTAAYFTDQELDSFYPEVVVGFTVRGGTEHYHVPLLLSPFGYSTYRGS